jgi:hypothetical protein
MLLLLPGPSRVVAIMVVSNDADTKNRYWFLYWIYDFVIFAWFTILFLVEGAGRPPFKKTAPYFFALNGLILIPVMYFFVKVCCTCYLLCTLFTVQHPLTTLPTKRNYHVHSQPP